MGKGFRLGVENCGSIEGGVLIKGVGDGGEGLCRVEEVWRGGLFRVSRAGRGREVREDWKRDVEGELETVEWRRRF
jgi:hypothetical protein